MTGGSSGGVCPWRASKPRHRAETCVSLPVGSRPTFVASLHAIGVTEGGRVQSCGDSTVDTVDRARQIRNKNGG